MSTAIRVPARAALLGNPSDGFGGATIAFTIEQLGAVVRASAAPAIGFETEDAVLELGDVAELLAVGRDGAYPPGGALALLMAAAKRFCEQRDPVGGFRLELVESTIPPLVGLAGSSAIVIAALRALGEHFAEPIPEDELPMLALACETEELGIPAGPQDRVVQARGGLLHMDFAPELGAAGRHEALDRGALPPLVVAWRRDAGTHSGAAHARLRARFERGDREVLEALAEIATLARAGRDALIAGDHPSVGALMTRNLDLRRRLEALDPRHEELVTTARRFALPANYAGSGGAIVALATDPERAAAARGALAALGCEVLAPG